MKIDVKEVAYGVAFLAAGFAAYRLYSNFKSAQKSVGGAIDSVGVAFDTAKKAATTLVTKDLNPASQENVVNRGVSSALQWATGDDNFTLGGWIYDITHPEPAKPEAHPQSALPVYAVTHSDEIVPDGSGMTQSEVAKSNFRQYEIDAGKNATPGFFEALVSNAKSVNNANAGLFNLI